MERRFGHDFSRVRVHADGKASDATRAVDAQAYTIGHHIVFGAGQYAPTTPQGERLLAHELTHVLQQSGAGPENLRVQLHVGEPNDVHEQEADRVANAVVGVGTGPVRPAVHGFELAGRVVQRQKGGAAKAPPAPSWTVEELKKMLDTCDGGLGIWAKAKKANKDKDPIVAPGAGGEVEPSTGKITLDRTLDKCAAVQQLIQELSNLSRKADFDKLDHSALAGGVPRDDYIKDTERIEYESGVKNVLTAFDSCKDKWPCTTSPKEWARKAKNFDEYFTKLLSPKHKEFYGDWWDKNCKKAFDKKQAKKAP
jgi:hypothetical protein